MTVGRHKLQSYLNASLTAAPLSVRGSAMSLGSRFSSNSGGLPETPAGVQRVPETDVTVEKGKMIVSRTLSSAIARRFEIDAQTLVRSQSGEGITRVSVVAGMGELQLSHCMATVAVGLVWSSTTAENILSWECVDARMHFN